MNQILEIVNSEIARSVREETARATIPGWYEKKVNLLSDDLLQDLEEIILSAILCYPEAIEKAKVLPPNAFTWIEHRRIFIAALELYEQGRTTNLMTIASHLDRKGLLRESGGQSKLASLCSLPSNIWFLDSQVSDLLEEYQRRVLANITVTPDNMSQVIEQLEAFQASQSTGLRQQLTNLIDKGLRGFDLAEELAKLARRNARGLNEVKYLYEECERETANEADRLSDVHKFKAILKANKSSINLSEVLPKKLARPFTELCKRLNVKPMMALTVLLGAISSLHRPATDLTLARSSGFSVSPGLYTGIVAPPSQKKSPILKAIASDPLGVLQVRAVENFETELAAWEEEKKASEGNPESEDLPPKPTLPLYHFGEATGESIIKQFDRQPDKGLCQISDELASVIFNQNKYRGGKGSDRQDLLSYYDGTKQTVMRVDEARGVTGKALLGIVGGIQPAVLKKLMGSCTDEDGLWSRFLFCYQPITASYLADDSGSYDIKDLLVSLYTFVDRLPVQNFTLSKTAFKLFQSAANKYERKRVDEDSEGMQAVWGKCAGRVGKIALNLHCIWAWADDQPPSATISEEIIQMAIALTDYYADQMLAFHNKFSEPYALPSNLAKVVEIAERKGGTVGASEISRSFTNNHRPKVAEVYGWFKLLKEEGFGIIEGEGRNSRFILSDYENAESSIFCEDDSTLDTASPPDPIESSPPEVVKPEKKHQPLPTKQRVKCIFKGSERLGLEGFITSKKQDTDGTWLYNVFFKTAPSQLRNGQNIPERWLEVLS